ncbi:MAG: hypothetical protein M0Z61_13065 [Nitrospiraceae bacterium]|nr:hypothetical protein [Nitrospiraceae bacterium]
MRKEISHWEEMAFLLIGTIANKNSYFSRSKLMTPKNLNIAIIILRKLGHKENPEHPEETLQRTIQNLRDKGYIEFLGRGEYRLTEKGILKKQEIFDKVAEKISG